MNIFEDMVEKGMTDNKKEINDSSLKESNYFSYEQIRKFLLSVDKLFPIYLSKKTDINELANKYLKNALLYGFLDNNNEIVAMIVGYVNDEATRVSYISLLAVKPEVQNMGLASKLVDYFISKVKESSYTRVFLYTHKTNLKAIALYMKKGFIQEFDLNRPDDIKFTKEIC